MKTSINKDNQSLDLASLSNLNSQPYGPISNVTQSPFILARGAKSSMEFSNTHTNVLRSINYAASSLNQTA